MNLEDFKLKKEQVYSNAQPAEQNGLLKSIRYTWIDTDNPVATVLIEYFENSWTSCSNLKVFKAYRGKGLSHQVVEYCKTLGVNNLSVSPKNYVAISLYKKHGFEFIGEHDGSYLRMRAKKGK